MDLPPLVPFTVHGRGAAGNPANRFVPIDLIPDGDALDLALAGADELPSPQTHYLNDASRSIIAYNDSPDIGFTASLNPYRGCEHGCIYCYARPTHEYLGLSAGLDFETQIFVKRDAPELLRKELAAKKWKPQCVAMSGVTDCYQPIEHKLRLTRRCLEVFLDYRNPVGIVTKNAGVLRDIDVLSGLARFDCTVVYVSITTLDAALSAKMEPRASAPARRLAAVAALAKAGVPVGVLTAPVVPGLTDHEIPTILAAAADAGATSAGYVPLRLPGNVSGLFDDWLSRHFPDRKDKILNRVRSIRGGKLNDANFGSRMIGHGEFADQIAQMFALGCRKAGIGDRGPHLSTGHFRVPLRKGAQLSLFE